MSDSDVSGSSKSASSVSEPSSSLSASSSSSGYPFIPADTECNHCPPETTPKYLYVRLNLDGTACDNMCALSGDYELEHTGGCVWELGLPGSVRCGGATYTVVIRVTRAATSVIAAVIFNADPWWAWGYVEYRKTTAGGVDCRTVIPGPVPYYAKLNNFCTDYTDSDAFVILGTS